MALRIAQEQIEALLFLTAPTDEVDKNRSETFTKVKMHYDFPTMPKGLYDIFTALYTKHLSPNLKTFGVLRSLR